MRLRDLDASLVNIIDGEQTQMDVAWEEAQGVTFQCPKCAAAGPVEEENGERFVRGAHYVLCWFSGRGVPDGRFPRPGRWERSGTGLDDLTLSPSVHLTGPGCGWHGFVRNGDAT